MKNILLMGAALCLIAPAIASANDTQMTCDQINDEIGVLNQIQTAAGSAQTNDTVARAGAAAATQTAIMTGAGSSIPFIGGLANIATSVAANKSETAQRDAEEAEKRMIKLQTISEMKGC